MLSNNVDCCYVMQISSIEAALMRTLSSWPRLPWKNSDALRFCTICGGKSSAERILRQRIYGRAVTAT
jgi:hypothetical protein